MPSDQPSTSASPSDQPSTTPSASPSALPSAQPTGLVLDMTGTTDISYTNWEGEFNRTSGNENGLLCGISSSHNDDL
jgi:hypothetical protein